VEGWEDDNQYVSGGGDWLFSASPDTSGVSGAAPPEVYRTLRHAAGDTGFTFSVPSLTVPNGQYTVKLHFYDEYNEAERSMDVTIEGVKVLDDFNIAEEAGSGRALVKEFVVTVSDGDGLQIVGDKDTGNDVFWSAFEIHEGGTQTSDVTIDSFGATPGTIDQGASSTLVWSTSNATSVTLDGNAVDADGSFTVIPTETTTHTLVADGPGGPVTQETTVTVIIVTPTLTLLSPVGGEVWYVGTTPHIQWTASNQDNVMILYSADGGATWEIVAGTILSTAPEWGDAPWTIPDTPSTNCILHIRDYFDVQPSDVSDTFEIRAATDSDSDGMDDSWETYFFGDLTHDGSADSDGDGATDLEEFMAGTDPLASPGGGSDTGFSCAPSTRRAGFAFFAVLLAAAWVLRRRAAALRRAVAR
jgi:hypothetical protein